MKIIAALLTFCSLNAHATVGNWYYGATITNPTTSSVFTTSGALPTSGSSLTPPTANYQVGMDLYCSVNETYEVVVMNGTVSQAAVPYSCCANCGAGANHVMNVLSFPIQDGWKVNIVPAANFTGFGAAQLFMGIESANGNH